ncbi:MAG: aminoglycoside phosphotransferase family protein [Candidatus Micrarchaeia archaeon]
MEGRLKRFLSPRIGRIEKITPLPGGIWNDSFLIAGEKRFVAKVFSARLPLALYRNSGWIEWRTLRLLEPLGIAPKPVLFAPRSEFPAGQLLVYEYAEGRTGRLKGRFLELAARAIAGFHSIHPARRTRFVSLGDDSIPAIHAAIKARMKRLENKMPGNEDLARFKKSFALLPATASPAYSPCLLHTDLVPSNFIQGKKLVLIDWQSPRFGDAAFDVWAFCSDAFTLWDLKQGMSKGEKRAFLRAYLGRCRDATLPARLRAKAPLFALNVGLYYLERFTDFKNGRLPRKITRGKEKLFQRYEKVKNACLRELEKTI